MSNDTTTTETATETIPSTRALAKLLNVSEAAIRQHWMKRGDWRFSEAPWEMSQLPDLEAYRDSIRAVGGPPVDAELKQARLRQVNAAAFKLELANAQTEGQLVQREQVREILRLARIRFRDRLIEEVGIEPAQRISAKLRSDLDKLLGGEGEE